MILGIDDAGRGPLIGPMFLAGVLLTKEQEATLSRAGVTDSKALSHSRRITLAETIRKTATSYHVVATSANEIDEALTTGTNLNTLEAQKTAEIINTLNTKKEKITVIVDCPSVNITAWQATLMHYINHPQNLIVKCEHKADANHVAAAAGSIVAKVAREDAVTTLKKQYGDFGSGYPSDPKTKAFLIKKGKILAHENLFRKTWATYQKHYPSLSHKKQKTLTEF